MSSTSRDFYDILQISQNASVQEIKLAYRTLAKVYHPDANPSNTNTTTQLFQEINRAYQVLTDPLVKKRYDMYGNTGVGASNGHSNSAASAPQQQDNVHPTVAKRQHATESSIVGQDLRIDLNVGMVGGEKWVTIKYPQTCFTCQGVANHMWKNDDKSCTTCGGQGVIQHFKEVQVRIPSGVDSGNLLKVYGEGIPGTNGAPAGDLYVFLNVNQGSSSIGGSYVHASVGNCFWLEPDFEQYSSTDYMW